MNPILSLAVARPVTLRAKAPEMASLEQYWSESDGDEEDVISVAMAGDAPPGTFFDYATVHLLTTSSIDPLRKLYPVGASKFDGFAPIWSSKPKARKGALKMAGSGKPCASATTSVCK